MPSRYRQEVVQESPEWQFIENASFESKKAYAANLAKTYNKRLRRLEKAGVESSAYKQMIYENGRRNFYTGTKYKDEAQVNRAIKRMLNFGTMESSTVAGYRAGWKTRLETFRRNHPDISKDVFSDQELIDLFEGGFGTDFKYTSDEDLNTARSLKEQGITVDEMLKAKESLHEKNVAEPTQYQLLKEAMNIGGNRG